MEQGPDDGATLKLLGRDTGKRDSSGSAGADLRTQQVLDLKNKQ